MLTIIIVNWNSGTQLRTCIDSIAQYGAGLVSHAIVVDNGSTDKSDSGAENLPNITLIRAGTNLGFAKACNLGAKYAQSEFLLFLNPDAALYEGTLPKVLDYMRDPANHKIGICGVQLLDEENHVSRSCVRFPTSMNFIAHSLGIDRFIPRLGYFMAEWDHTQTR